MSMRVVVKPKAAETPIDQSPSRKATITPALRVISDGSPKVAPAVVLRDRAAHDDKLGNAIEAYKKNRRDSAPADKYRHESPSRERPSRSSPTDVQRSHTHSVRRTAAWSNTPKTGAVAARHHSQYSAPNRVDEHEYISVPARPKAPPRPVRRDQSVRLSPERGQLRLSTETDAPRVRSGSKDSDHSPVSPFSVKLDEETPLLARPKSILKPCPKDATDEMREMHRQLTQAHEQLQAKIQENEELQRRLSDPDVPVVDLPEDLGKNVKELATVVRTLSIQLQERTEDVRQLQLDAAQLRKLDETVKFSQSCYTTANWCLGVASVPAGVCAFPPAVPIAAPVAVGIGGMGVVIALTGKIAEKLGH